MSISQNTLNLNIQFHTLVNFNHKTLIQQYVILILQMQRELKTIHVEYKKVVKTKTSQQSNLIIY